MSLYKIDAGLEAHDFFFPIGPVNFRHCLRARRPRNKKSCKRSTGQKGGILRNESKRERWPAKKTIQASTICKTACETVDGRKSQGSKTTLPEQAYLMLQQTAKQRSLRGIFFTQKAILLRFHYYSVMTRLDKQLNVTSHSMALL